MHVFCRVCSIGLIHFPYFCGRGLFNALYCKIYRDFLTWNDEAKLKWIKVCLAGRAQKALQGLPEEARGSYDNVKVALTQRFEPASKRELYNAELQVRAKKHGEGWANFAEDLRRLVDKAYPDLEANAREQLALSQYLSRLHNPQVGFAVKQQRPRKLEEAVRITLEVESYLVKTPTVAQVQTPSNISDVDQDQFPVASVKQSTELALVRAVDQLTQRLERLEDTTRRRDTAVQSRRYGEQATGETRKPDQGRGTVICHRCGKEGHYARGCALRRPQRQGN